MKVAILGSGGQLGRCINKEVTRREGEKSTDITYIFYSHREIDITSDASIDMLRKNIPDVIINCAAYTNVEMAENDYANVCDINIKGPYNLARFCKENNIFLIHFSTDFVFDGEKNTPYKENDFTKPLNMYGLSKVMGEKSITDNMETDFLIFRTSWLYSEFGKNFAKTMADKIQSDTSANVVVDQIGSPTYAMDLANFIVEIIENGDYKKRHGIYNFSNGGTTTWYDFAKRIEMKLLGDDYGLIKPCLSKSYPTKAKRPQYSVLDKNKLRIDFQYEAPYWDESLNKFIKNIK